MTRRGDRDLRVVAAIVDETTNQIIAICIG